MFFAWVLVAGCGRVRVVRPNCSAGAHAIDVEDRSNFGLSLGWVKWGCLMNVTPCDAAGMSVDDIECCLFWCHSKGKSVSREDCGKLQLEVCLLLAFYVECLPRSTFMVPCVV